MKRRIFFSLLAIVLMTLVFALPILNGKLTQRREPSSENIDKASKNIVEHSDQSSQNEDTPRPVRSENVTYFVSLKEESLLETVNTSKGRYGSVRELLLSADGKSYVDAIKKSQAIVKASIQKLVSGSDFSGCRTYLAVMNGFTVKAPAGSEARLQSINGVSSVVTSVCRDYFFTEEEEESSGTEQTKTETSDTAAYPSRLSDAPRKVIDLEEATQSGYDGSGVLIAVLDTEFNTDHEAFSVLPDQTKLSRDELAGLYQKIYFNTDALPENKVPYVSRKIAFAYDYAANKAATRDQTLEHGTAVAAAAAGNNGKTGADACRGIAGNAQLALMKVAAGKDNAGRIYTEPSVVLAALDDSVKMGADVICMSFGQYRQSDNAALYAPVMKAMSRAGIYLVCPSGNGSFNGSSYPGQSLRAADIDYGTGNYLSALDGVLTVGSTDNLVSEQKYFVSDGHEVYYRDLCHVHFDTLHPEKNQLPYICLDADGIRADYQDEETEGKLVIINQSVLTADKVYENAVAYGAAALAVIASEEETDYRPENIKPDIPMILLNHEWASHFQEAPNGTIQVMDYGRLVSTNERVNVASHTSYDTLPGLRLSPRVLACGDDVYAASANGAYDFYSGSSMACAQGAGMCALLRQYSTEGLNLPVYAAKSSQIAKALLMSTAEPLTYGKNTAGDQLYVSPRLQGAGIIQADKALTSQAYLTNQNGEPFSGSFGDSTDGSYRFSFMVHNLSDTPAVFRPTLSLQTDRYKADDELGLLNTLKPLSLVGKAEIHFSQKGEELTSVTVPAGESVLIETDIRLDSRETERLMTYFPNGFYLDGILLLQEENGSTLYAGLTGFYGNQSELEPFDGTPYDEQPQISGLPNSLCAAARNGSEYACCTLQQIDGTIVFSKNAVSSYTENNAFSSSWLLPDLNLLRDAYEMKISVLNEQGNTLVTCDMGTVSAYRDSGHRPFEQLMEKSGELERFFATLPDGSYRYRISCRVMGADGKLSTAYTRTYPFIADSVKPTDLKSNTYIENGRIMLELSAKDTSGIADFLLYAASYNRSEKDYRYADRLSEVIAAGFIAEDCYTYLDKKIQPDGTTVFRYDITNLSSELVKLKLHTSSWVNKSSSLKIAYKAFDQAYNQSGARIADAIVYGTAEFVFTDQNGNPAKGLTVQMDDRRLTTDRSGKIVFDGLRPDYYLAELIYDDTLYQAQNTRFLVHISNEELEYREKVTVEYLGQYTEDAEPSDSSQSAPEESNLNHAETPSEPDGSGSDDPRYAILFISSLLAIGGIALLWRMKRTGKSSL